MLLSVSANRIINANRDRKKFRIINPTPIGFLNSAPKHPQSKDWPLAILKDTATEKTDSNARVAAANTLGCLLTISINPSAISTIIRRYVAAGTREAGSNLNLSTEIRAADKSSSLPVPDSRKVIPSIILETEANRFLLPVIAAHGGYAAL